MANTTQEQFTQIIEAFNLHSTTDRPLTERRLVTLEMSMAVDNTIKHTTINTYYSVIRQFERDIEINSSTSRYFIAALESYYDKKAVKPFEEFTQTDTVYVDLLNRIEDLQMENELLRETLEDVKRIVVR